MTDDIALLARIQDKLEQIARATGKSVSIKVHCSSYAVDSPFYWKIFVGEENKPGGATIGIENLNEAVPAILDALRDQLQSTLAWDEKEHAEKLSMLESISKITP